MKTSKKQSGSHDHDKNGGDSENRHQAIISLAYDDWEELLELLDIDEVKYITQTLASLKTRIVLRYCAIFVGRFWDNFHIRF